MSSPADRLVVLGGSGDAYLVLSLLDAFRRAHGRSSPRVILRSRVAPVARLWGYPCEIDDELVSRGEYDRAFQESYENPWGDPSRPYFVHPCLVRTSVRIDQLTIRNASQADMYRLLLRLPFDAPMTLPLPEFRHPKLTVPGSVVIIEDSTSWPNLFPGFWMILAERLRTQGWQVYVNDKTRSLDDLLRRCSTAEWVIGPQCGVMSILVTGQFACRKTLATPSMDGNRIPYYLAKQTFPYAYVTKFAGEDHDVEEFKITADNHEEVVSLIMNGSNARRLWKHDPAPVMTIEAPLSPGDFLDRLAVLTVKRTKFEGVKAAAIEREYQRFSEIKRQLRLSSEAEGLFRRLVRHHFTCYELLGKLVPSALNGGDHALANGHIEAIKANRVRMELKSLIDDHCHAPYKEVKDYYSGG